MTAGGERALLTRLLREFVLTLCREAMTSYRRLSVDGIVCISLGDDDSGDDCSPIVVTIHEQLPKVRDERGTTSPLVLPKPTPNEHDGVAEIREDIDSVPMEKERKLLERVIRAHLESGQQDVVPVESISSTVVKHRRCISERLACKQPTLQEREGDGLRCPLLDGHCSDPTPERRPLIRHSISQSSEGSEKAMSSSGRASLSSPASSSSISSNCDDSSVVGRAGSASPQETTYKPCPMPRTVRSTAPTSGRLQSRRGIRCGRCDMELADVLSLERHNLQVHACFTCHVCFSTFTARNNLKRHIRMHTGIKPFKCDICSAAFSRRDDFNNHRQRHINNRTKVYGNIRHRHDNRCKFCAFVAQGPVDLRKHLLTHVPRNRMTCSPCNLTFTDPVAYASHVKSHREDPEFRDYPCCVCSAVLPSYPLFLAHQQSHLLSRIPLHDCSLCGKQFRSAAHLREHLTTHRPRSAESDQHRSSVEARPASVIQSSHRSESPLQQDCFREKDKRDFSKEEEAQEASSGPRQSWCTVCQVGFPDEDTLIQHITDTHQAVSNGRRPQGPELQSQTAAENEDDSPQNESMDTSESKQANGEVDEDQKRDGKDAGKSEPTEQAMETDQKGRQFEDSPHGKDDEGGRLSEEKRRVVEEFSSMNEDLPKGLSTRSEALGRHDASECLQDASSVAVSLRNSVSPPSRKASPLRIVPLPLSEDGPTRTDPATARSPVPGTTMTSSLIRLEKPNDLFIDSDIHQASSYPSASGFSFVDHGFPSDRAVRYRDSLGAAGDKKGDSRLVNNFLQLERTSPSSYWSHSATLSHASRLGIKQESLSDQEDSAGYDMLGGRYLDQLRDYPDQPQLSPINLVTVNRSISTSPGSTGSESGKSPSFEKVVTPEVLFRERSPLLCSIKDCGEQFLTFADLEEHSARLHRRYLCEYCGKTFTAKPNRDRHVRYHTGDKPYKCSICSQAFHRGDDLKYHRTTKHPRDSSY